MTAKITLYMADNGSTKSTSFNVDPSNFQEDMTETVQELADTISDLLKYPVIRAAYNETTVVEIA